jgi:hypothetical protein
MSVKELSNLEGLKLVPLLLRTNGDVICLMDFYALNSYCQYPEDRVPPCTSSKSRQKLGQLRGRRVSPLLRRPPPGSRQLRGRHVSPGLQHPPPGIGQLRGRRVSRCSSVRLLAQGSSGSPRVTCPPAPSFWLKAALELPHVPWMGFTGCKQLNKYSLTTRPS